MEMTVLYYSKDSLQLRVLACLKLLNDRFKPLERGKRLYDLFFQLRKHGYLKDLEFEDNLNPISLNLDRLLIGYGRNKIISMDPVKILDDGKRLVKRFLKSHPDFKKIKNLDING